MTLQGLENVYRLGKIKNRYTKEEKIKKEQKCSKKQKEKKMMGTKNKKKLWDNQNQFLKELNMEITSQIDGLRNLVSYFKN